MSPVLRPGHGPSSLAPGQYIRLLLVGYFGGIDSERGIGWCAADSDTQR
jgi:transposase